MDVCRRIRKELLNGKESNTLQEINLRMWAGKSKDVWHHFARKVVLSYWYYLFSTGEKVDSTYLFCREYAKLVGRYIDNHEDVESMNSEVVSIDLINLIDEDESNG